MAHGSPDLSGGRARPMPPGHLEPVKSMHQESTDRHKPGEVPTGPGWVVIRRRSPFSNPPYGAWNGGLPGV
ncbi:MAG: hypothetical protein KGL95_01410 [Patescibacteria group bacterium]|nr:hypothetical protein [Patescibacteria group bacterium]